MTTLLTTPDAAFAPDDHGEPATTVPVEISPVVFRGIGTTAGWQLRHAQRCLVEQCGGVPPHVVSFGTDTTAQENTTLLAPLAPENHCNLSLKDGLQEKLAGLETNPAYRDWFDLRACRLRLGSGAGSVAAIARFLFLEGHAAFKSGFSRAVSRLRGAQRVAVAAEAGERLRELGLTVSTEGPVDVVYVLSTPGGTTAALLDDARATKAVFNEMNVPTRFRVFVTLPAVGGADDVDLARMRRMTYGRLQELSDQNSGERLFDYVTVLPEPNAAAMEDHHRLVGEMLARLALHHGKSLNDKSVDMLALHHEHGPLGLRKFADLANLTVLKPTPYRDVVAFVESRLGQEALASAESPSQSASAWLAEHGLTAAPLARRAVQLTPSPVPDWVNNGNVGGFLTNCRRQLEAAAKQLVEKKSADLA
jgi:hypothetical protein